MCLIHPRYRSEVKIFKIFTTFALSFISLYIFTTKTGGAIALQPPHLRGACSQKCVSLILSTKKLLTVNFYNPITEREDEEFILVFEKIYKVICF